MCSAGEWSAGPCRRICNTDLVFAALEMALWSRRPAAGLIHHSDQGCPYTSLHFGQRCQAAGIRSSMGTVGDCYDNAMMECIFATLERLLLATHRFPRTGPAPAYHSLMASSSGAGKRIKAM